LKHTLATCAFSTISLRCLDEWTLVVAELDASAWSSPVQQLCNYRIKLDKAFFFNLRNKIPSCFTLWNRRSLTGGL
jgi:hypothetical protein